MKITDEWTKKHVPCKDAMDFIKAKTSSRGRLTILRLLIKEDKLYWANWFIVRTMEYKQYVDYACFAALQVIDIFEKEYPEDKKPRKAIKAALKCVEDPSEENKAAAAAYDAASASAAYAASAAAYAASAAAYAAASAASADAAAASAAASAADAYAASAASAAAHAYAYAADASAASAASAAAYAYAYASRKGLRLKILNYGIKITEENK